jgi:hypothetical protein
MHERPDNILMSACPPQQRLLMSPWAVLALLLLAGPLPAAGGVGFFVCLVRGVPQSDVFCTGNGGTMDGLCSLGPDQGMSLAFEVPATLTTYRISFEYSCEAGPLQKLLSPSSSRLFPPEHNPTRPATFRARWVGRTVPHAV